MDGSPPPPSQAESPSRGAARRWLAWWPVPAVLVAMAALRAAEPAGTFDPPLLMLALNVVFSTSVSALVAYLVARTFLARGNPGLLMVGCGAVVWGAGGVVAAAAGQGNVDTVVTIHNLSVWVAGACHLGGVTLSLRRAGPVRSAGAWLAVGYLGALGVVALAAGSALGGWTPAFFVQGQGGTPVRQAVLGTAVGMFATASLLLATITQGNPSRFSRWYAPALALVAAGLLGVMLQTSHGGALGWLGRGAQYLSGVYMLVAAIASIQETRAWGLPLEAALQESESRYRALFDHSLDAILVAGADGRIIAANPAACALFGRTEEALRRTTRGALVAPGDARLPAIMDSLRQAGMVRAEIDYLGHGGRRFEAELSSIRIDPDGRAFDIVRDLSGQRRAEEALRAMEREAALRASEAKFRALIERSMDMILVLDAAGSVQFCSPSVAVALGWSEAVILGRGVLQLVHPEDAQALADTLDGVLTGPGATARLTARFRHLDGSLRVVESVARNLLHDPVVRGVVVNSRDVTEQRRLEDEHRQSQKLESIGRLAGGVAHDFNNLLTAIRGSAQLALDDLPPGAPGRADLEEIDRSAQRAAALTRQLLAFSRRQVLAPRLVDLTRTVRVALQMLARLVGEDVALDLKAPPGALHVRVDPAQVDQILANLVVNARDAMPGGGTIRIELRSVPTDEPAPAPDAAPGRWVELTVSDTGTGMSPEVKRHLYEPFFTTKPKGTGTGLGLASVHGIVHQTGGSIAVVSEVGAGTTVRIRLPAAEEGARDLPLPAAPAPRAGTETVLVVEDEATVREVARRVLQRQGYHVIAVGTPEAAVAALEGRVVHLLLTDVIMPEVNGRELAARLTAIQPGLRTLFMSGYSADIIAPHGVLAPGMAFLEKPFTVEALSVRVREVLDAAAGTSGRPG